MRAIWNGSISFGLVNVPVKLYGATEDHDISFRQVHDKDGGRIHYERRCEACGEKVEFKHIQKAYDDGDDTVVVTDKDFDSLPEAEKDEIEVVQFVPSDQVDPIMLSQSYFVRPADKSPKSYLLLRKTLEETDRTAIVKFALRQKTRLGALHVRDDVLVLQAMLWADEVRAADFKETKSKAKVSDKELELSSALVEQYSSDFTPEEFEDDYQKELRELVEHKLEEGETIDAKDSDTSASDADTDSEADDDDDAEVVDLMEALQNSLKKKGGKKSSSSSESKKDDDGEDSDDGNDSGSSSKKSSKKSSSSKSSSKSKSKSKSGSKSSSKSKSKKKSA